MSFDPLKYKTTAGLDEEGRSAAWVEIETKLAQFETRDGFVGPCELIVASAAK